MEQNFCVRPSGSYVDAAIAIYKKIDHPTIYKSRPSKMAMPSVSTA